MDLGEAAVHWAACQRSASGARGAGCFSSRQLCTLLWACAAWGHDALGLFEAAGEVLVARALHKDSRLPAQEGGWRGVARIPAGAR